MKPDSVPCCFTITKSMDKNNNIQATFQNIKFNPYKHHLNFLRMKTEKWKESHWTEAEKEIKNIGNNLIDLYFGRLTVHEIFNEVTAFTGSKDLHTRRALTEWLKPFDYKKITLSDGSVWVIREGHDSTRFIHIHPGKYSPLTIRVRAPALKTVIALCICGVEPDDADVQTVNHIRKTMLHLSPVKSLVKGRGLSRLLAGFNSL